MIVHPQVPYKFKVKSQVFVLKYICPSWFINLSECHITPSRCGLNKATSKVITSLTRP
jgi:hypothetical protein